MSTEISARKASSFGKSCPSATNPGNSWLSNISWAKGLAVSSHSPAPSQTHPKCQTSANHHAILPWKQQFWGLPLIFPEQLNLSFLPTMAGDSWAAVVCALPKPVSQLEVSEPIRRPRFSTGAGVQRRPFKSHAHEASPPAAWLGFLDMGSFRVSQLQEWLYSPTTCSVYMSGCPGWEQPGFFCGTQCACQSAPDSLACLHGAGYHYKKLRHQYGAGPCYPTASPHRLGSFAHLPQA